MAEKHEHDPNWETVSVEKENPIQGTLLTLRCKLCPTSGSVIIFNPELVWDDDPEVSVR